MNTKLEEMIFSEILEQDNKKIKDESLEEYLTSFKKEQLVVFAMYHAMVMGDANTIIKLDSFNNKSKKYIVEYVMDNLEDILEVYIKLLSPNNIERLSVLVNKLKVKDYDVTNENFSLEFIMTCKNFCLAKVEYNKSKQLIKMAMPEEYLQILEKYLKDKKLLKINKENEKIYDFVDQATKVYGIITIDELHKMYESIIGEIEGSDFYYTIFYKSKIDNRLEIHETEKEILICNLEFMDADFAYEFSLAQKGKYKQYSKEELKKYASRKYIEELDSYQEFIAFLEKNYNISKKDYDYINDFIIFDYLVAVQTSKKVADANFQNNMSQMFELSNRELNYLNKLLIKMYTKTPKWIKRGNI